LPKCLGNDLDWNHLILVLLRLTRGLCVFLRGNSSNLMGMARSARRDLELFRCAQGGLILLSGPEGAVTIERDWFAARTRAECASRIEEGSLSLAWHSNRFAALKGFSSLSLARRVGDAQAAFEGGLGGARLKVAEREGLVRCANPRGVRFADWMMARYCSRGTRTVSLRSRGSHPSRWPGGWGMLKPPLKVEWKGRD